MNLLYIRKLVVLGAFMLRKAFTCTKTFLLHILLHIDLYIEVCVCGNILNIIFGFK